MSLAADALQPQIVKELVSLSGRAPLQHMMDVITEAPKAGYDLDFDAATSSIRIDFREPSYLGAAVGGDACRFAAAAFTSINAIEVALEDPATLAWGLIRSYYAAFYSGHSTLRLLGRSCSQLDSGHARQLRNLGHALGSPAPFDINAGLYSCVLSPSQTAFTLTQARGRVGGAHEAFWEFFASVLSGIAENVLTGHLAPNDARSVFLKLEALDRILRRGAGAAWLSAVRNEIQYRHTRGVWTPLSVNRTKRRALSRLSAQWLRDPMGIDVEAPPEGDLGAFVAASAFLVALCRALLTRISERSTVGARSFARAPLQLC